MDTGWSDFIQTPEELYASRAIRYREDNRNIWLSAMGIEEGMRILDVGCASGQMLHRIKALMPGVCAHGLDRDAGHIAFAKEKAQALGLECAFEVGDALALPYGEETFDLTFSHTVMEHVPHGPFLAEQRRVLKAGGQVVVMMVMPRYNIVHMPQAEDDEEQALMKKLWKGIQDGVDDAYAVGKYDLSARELPAALEAAGFLRVNVDVITLVAYAPDNDRTPEALARQQIKEERTASFACLVKGLKRNPDGLTTREKERLEALIERRYTGRLALYQSGWRLWDIMTSTVAVATGVKTL